MSTFKVTVERIAKVYQHPNADKLELAQVESMTFQFCVQKGDYIPGDLVVYFPVDSVLPQKLIDVFGISNFLAGKDKNRLKTVKLRGQISQGFVVKPAVIDHLIEFSIGDDLTTILGVTKYEAPEVPCHAGNLVPHPDGITHYDIEGCDRYPAVVAALMNQKVMITEKMEGSNHYTSILPDDSIVVGQRCYQIKPIEGATHDWWKAAEAANHFELLREMKRDFKANQVTLRSEICGPKISGNIYNYSKHILFTFDILVDGEYLNASDFTKTYLKYRLTPPPVLAYGVMLSEWLNGKTLQEAAHGTTLFSQKQGVLREGIVIKPMEEQRSVELGGRLFLKQRDPIYLEKTGA